MKRGLGIALIFLGTVVAQAQQSSTTVEGTSGTKLKDVQGEASKKKWGVKIGIATSSNMYEEDDYNNSLENEYVVAPNYKLSEKVTASLVGTFRHNLRHEDESDFDNTVLLISHAPLSLIQDWLTLAPTVLGVAPTNEKIRTNNTLIAATGGILSTSLSFKPLRVPASLTYVFGAIKNFNEYELNERGTANTQYVLTNGLVAAYELSEKWTLVAGGKLVSGYTYSEIWKSKFEISQILSYKILENVEIAVGHVNGGNTLKSDMETSNVEVFNENSSSVIGGVEAVF